MAGSMVGLWAGLLADYWAAERAARRDWSMAELMAVERAENSAGKTVVAWVAWLDVIQVDQ